LKVYVNKLFRNINNTTSPKEKKKVHAKVDLDTRQPSLVNHHWSCCLHMASHTTDMWTHVSLLQLASVLVVVICLCPLVVDSRDVHNRQKRGFRLNSASRVAHGYGKRTYEPENADVNSLARETLSSLIDSRGDDQRDDGIDASRDWTIMKSGEMASLIQSHSKLARALVDKFIDLDDDGVITTDELFRETSRD